MKLHCVFPVPVARAACDTIAVNTCQDTFVSAGKAILQSGTTAGLCR